MLTGFKTGRSAPLFRVINTHANLNYLQLLITYPMPASENYLSEQTIFNEIHTFRKLVFHDILTLDGMRNLLIWHPGNRVIQLNEAQKRFFYCLIRKITSKQQIISVVWHERTETMSDNNYHQLLFQSRSLLKRHGLPEGVLQTIPYHGVQLEESRLFSTTSQKQNSTVC